MRTYVYRSLQYNQITKDQAWCVQGYDCVNVRAGTLELCRDESDADTIIDSMLVSGEFRYLIAVKVCETTLIDKPNIRLLSFQ